MTRTTFENGVKYTELKEAVARSAQSRSTVYLRLLTGRRYHVRRAPWRR